MKKPNNWAVLFNEQIEWLSQFSEQKVFDILSASIRNGWQGLFEGKEPPSTNGHAQTNGAVTVVMGKEYDRVVERMKVIKSTYGDMQTWATEDKIEFNKLRTRRDELRKTLNITV